MKSTETLAKAMMLVAIVILGAAAAQAQTRYTVTDLGTLGGRVSGCAHGLNNQSQVAGVSSLPGDEINHVFLWEKGVISDLGTLGVSAGCVGTMGMNQKAVIAGQYYDGLTTRAFIWDRGEMLDLGTLGGSFAIAEGINNRDRVVGGSSLVGDANVHGYVWLDGLMSELPISFGGPNSFAHAINTAGWVAGEAESAGTTSRVVRRYAEDGTQYGEVETFHTFRAFLWRNGSARTLGALGGQLSLAMAMNDLGQVIGIAETAELDAATGWPLSHAYIWGKGVITDLGVLPGDNGSHANSINNKGQVVGTSGHGVNLPAAAATTITSYFGIIPYCPEYPGSWDSCFSFDHGFLWENGLMYNLDDLIPASSGWHIIAGDGINDRGEIAAAGYLPGQTLDDLHALLLRPTSRK